MSPSEQEGMDGSPRLISQGPSEDEWLRLKFQLGPVLEAGVNGTTIEAVIDVLLARLEGFQRGPFACAENERALAALIEARSHLEHRTRNRKAKGVEGLNKPH